METLLRSFFLSLSKNRVMNRLAKRWGLRFGANRFVAGETIQEAVNKVKELNRQGLSCTLDHLGEFISSREEAVQAAQYCIRTLEAIHESGIDCSLSVKLTQLGLDIDRDLCMENMVNILKTAEKYQNFVRIDMEDYSHNEATLELLRQLHERHGNVGTVIQAYLYKSEKDVRQLAGQNVNLRLVKGAYKESEKVAYPLKKDVDENFKKLIAIHLAAGAYTAVATHDDAIIHYTKQLAEQHGYRKDQFEFQMLYGIRPAAQLELAAEGYKMRVYVPYGNDWYGYFMRRLAERPANVAFVLKGMLRR